MATRPGNKVLLVGWDAADWKVIHPLIDAGQMPALKYLVENGVSGNISTLHPVLSPTLWTSIATGKRPFDHGVLGFSEPTPDGKGVQPITNLARKTKAVWNILSQCQKRSMVVGWWPSHPAEPIDGIMVSNHYQRAVGPLEDGWPMAPATVHPPELREELAALRFHPDEQVGPEILPFVPRRRGDRPKEGPSPGLLPQNPLRVHQYPYLCHRADRTPRVGFRSGLLRRHRSFFSRVHEVPSAATGADQGRGLRAL